MSFRVVLVLVAFLWGFAVAETDTNSSASTAKPTTSVTATRMNNSLLAPPDSHKGNHTKISENENSFEIPMIQRALYVLIGITIIGVLYFLVKAVRRKKTGVTHRKKYGLLSNSDDDMEMRALESDEDDTTVYEARALRR